MYLALVPIDAYFLRVTSTQWMVNILGMAVFLVLYFRAHWLRDRQLFWNIVYIAILGVALGPLNPGAAVYFVYAAAFAANLGNSSKVAVRVIAGLLVTIAGESALLRLSLPHD